MTLPLEAITFPYLVRHKTVSPGRSCLLLAITFFSIKAFCLFGGISVKVPEDVQIKIKSGFIFGGISDDRKGSGDKGKYTIYVDAAGGFGGVTIEDKGKKS